MSTFFARTQYNYIYQSNESRGNVVQEIRSVFKELYLSLDNTNVAEKESVYYNLLIQCAMSRLQTSHCSLKMKNQILGEVILIGKDVLDECLSIL